GWWGEVALRHGALLSLERLPRLLLEYLVDRGYDGVQLVVGRVEMRRNANARLGAIVHQDVARQQRLRDLVPVRHSEGDRAAAPLRVTRRVHRIATTVGERDEVLRLAHALGADGGNARATHESRPSERGVQRGDSRCAGEPAEGAGGVVHDIVERERMCVRLPARERR